MKWIKLQFCLFFALFCTAGELLNSAEITYKQNAAANSVDAGINISNYQGTQDAYLLNAGPFSGGASNFGGAPTLQVDFNDRLSLLRFDVSSMSGKFNAINSVTLRLYSQNAAQSGTTDVYRLADENSAWREGPNDGGSVFGGSQRIVTWTHLVTFGGIPIPPPTWNSGTGGPNVAGTDYDSSALGSVDNSGSVANSAFDFNITGDLSGLITDWSSESPIGSGQGPWTSDWNWQQPAPQAANEGFLLRGTDSSRHIFHSSEAGSGLEPELIINFEPSAMLLLGDFNMDGVVDQDDINSLYGAISMMNHPLSHDLTNDNQVTSVDMDRLIQDILMTTYGDANLDQLVNAGDLAILASNWLGTGVNWGTGDFNGDGRADNQDLALMGANWHSGVPVQSVPEPSTFILAAFAVLGVVCARRPRLGDVQPSDSTTIC